MLRIPDCSFQVASLISIPQAVAFCVLLFSATRIQAQYGLGIGGYDLASPNDRIVAFDYNGSGKQDHLLLYRPGTGILWILENSSGNFSPVFNTQGQGIAGYDLQSTADLVVPFDYNSSGKQDHLLLYRPGTGIVWILQNNGGTFSAVFNGQGQGIGGYDLKSTADRIVPFDYDGSGKLDHLLLYRPGTGIIWILKNNNGIFSPVFNGQGQGIGGYDLQSEADQILAFDYNGTGKLDHLILYRPGTGILWILQNNGGSFSAVFNAQGKGIGGYDLLSSADRVLALDYAGTGKQDHLLLYRPGTGIVWILQNSGGSFSAVFNSQSAGIGGYDLTSTVDQIVTFDYNGSGDLDHLVLYRAGDGIVWVVQRSGQTYSADYEEQLNFLDPYLPVREYVYFDGHPAVIENHP
jgi:hypothetical protein